jgi:hypothetical protein
VTLLGLLDLSAAFTFVDHNILLRRLHIAFGIDGIALQGIKSFLTKQIQHISYTDHLPFVSRLLSRVYFRALFNMIAECGLEGHISYAANIQAYISVPDAAAVSAVQQLQHVSDK